MVAQILALLDFDQCGANGSGGSYDCLNAVLRTLNSRSLSSSQYVDNMMLHDELARMGASVYAADESSSETITTTLIMLVMARTVQVRWKGISDAGTCRIGLDTQIKLLLIILFLD